jgi:predicted DNA binding CopG/RHH family protein
MSGEKLKPFPKFDTDEAAEAFVAEADLSEYDLSNMKPVRFEFATKEEGGMGRWC